MDQNRVEDLEGGDHLVDPRRRGRATQHVADGRDDPRGRWPALRRLEKRHQLEAKLRATEGKLFGQQDVRRLGFEQVEQHTRALRAKDIVERRAVELGQLLQAEIGGAQRRQLMKAHALERQAVDRRPARDQQHVEAA